MIYAPISWRRIGHDDEVEVLLARHEQAEQSLSDVLYIQTNKLAATKHLESDTFFSKTWLQAKA